MKKAIALLVVLLLLFALLTTALSACAPPELRGNVLRFGAKDLKALPPQAQDLKEGDSDVTVFASQQELDDFFSQYTRLSSDVLGDDAWENNFILLVARCDDADYDVEYTSFNPSAMLLYYTLTPRSNKKKPTLYLDVVLLPKVGRLAAVTLEELVKEHIFLYNGEEIIISDFYESNLLKYKTVETFHRGQEEELLSFLDEKGNGKKFYAMDVVNMPNLDICVLNHNRYTLFYDDVPLADNAYLSTSWHAFYTANGEPFTYKATFYPIPGATPDEKLTYEQVARSHLTGSLDDNRIIYVYSGANRFAEITYYARHVLPTSHFAKLIDNYLITIG